MAIPNNPNSQSFSGTTSSSNGQTAGASPARPQKISDALKVLDEALAKDNVNLKDIVSNDYQHLREAFAGMAPQIKDKVKDYSAQAYQQVQDYAAPAIDRSREMFEQVDGQVRENPWPVIGGVAVGSLALGFLLGRRNNSAE